MIQKEGPKSRKGRWICSELWNPSRWGHQLRGHLKLCTADDAYAEASFSLLLELMLAAFIRLFQSFGRMWIWESRLDVARRTGLGLWKGSSGKGKLLVAFSKLHRFVLVSKKSLQSVLFAIFSSCLQSQSSTSNHASWSDSKQTLLFEKFKVSTATYGLIPQRIRKAVGNLRLRIIGGFVRGKQQGFGYFEENFAVDCGWPWQRGIQNFRWRNHPSTHLVERFR